MKKVKLVIPESLDEITLGQYQRFMKVKGDSEFMSHKMLEIFCKVDLRDVLQLKITQIEEALSTLNNAFNQSPSLTHKMSLDGLVLGLLPNLMDITLGEYVDIEENIADWQTMHKAMAVLYRPINQKFGKLYNVVEYNGTSSTAESMKAMPISVVFGALNFMYRLGMDLSRDTLQFMETEIAMSEESKPVKSSSLNDGDGIHSFTPLRMAMLLSLRQCQNLMLPLLTPTSVTLLRSTT
jgi:hypothetical protein